MLLASNGSLSSRGFSCRACRRSSAIYETAQVILNRCTKCIYVGWNGSRIVYLLVLPSLRDTAERISNRHMLFLLPVTRYGSAGKKNEERFQR